MTGQSLLDRMEILNQELQLQSGEADVTRGLLALNIAQDVFEGFAAKHPGFLGSSVSTLTTTANQEYTTFPTGLVRLDALDFIDPSTSLPAWPIHNVHQVGRHAYSSAASLGLVASIEGKPQLYWTNGTRIYWEPVPTAVHTIRWYGLSLASDITAGGTFAYNDLVALPISLLAVKLLKMGVDDPTTDVDALAGQLFTPLLAHLATFNRDGAASLRYQTQHNT